MPFFTKPTFEVIITLGWALSISSSNKTLLGLFLISSKIFLLSSYPIYPGEEPSILLIAVLSLYSLISILIRLSAPTKILAYSLANLLLPTPEEPTNKRE